MRGKPVDAKPVAAWRAFDGAGVGHALARRRSDRTYCGRAVPDPRFDHPVRSRCAECVAATGSGLF